MNLKPLAANMTEIELDGKVILFSYQTPVAASIATCKLIRTSKFWSQTTTKHINKWLQGNEAQTVDQSVLNDLVK